MLREMGKEIERRLKIKEARDQAIEECSEDSDDDSDEEE